ncbi:MAG: leucyl aminopeptidase [Pseudomonadales bacterium]|nr:leucyl aminopeptidase [Pseudomonadales bacterium]
MEFTTRTADPARTRTQCLIVGVYENNGLTPSAAEVDKASGGAISALIKSGDFSGKGGESHLLHGTTGTNAARILVIGLGNEDTGDAARFMQIANTTAAALTKTSAVNAICCLLETSVGDKDGAWKARRLIEQFEAGAYKYTAMRGTPPTDNGKLARVTLLTTKDETRAVNKAVKEGMAVAAGTNAAKDLANTPGNICHPTYVAEQAVALAKAYPSLKTTVLEEKQMEKLGMGCLLSVSRGSEQPAKLIIIEHKGGKAREKPHVLVGKGITFDTGGISLKPAGTMYEMIYDMCGAASVFGAMKTVAELNLPINVVCVIAAAENMPSGKATRPGDIVKSMSGQTVEILNTDAEGRLVLCDALTYIEKFNPETVIDVATLTGACVVALGAHASAMYANDEDVATRLQDAGETSMDRIWRMPLWEEYQSQLNSAFADMANIGGPQAGSVTAACFLSRFTKKYRWAHLDIAGTAYKAAGAVKGATGRPVNLLTQYLIDQSRKR